MTEELPPGAGDVHARRHAPGSACRTAATPSCCEREPRSASRCCARRSSSIGTRPLARLVRLRLTAAARSSSCASPRRAPCASSPARVSWCRGARALEASTASASACRRGSGAAPAATGRPGRQRRPGRAVRQPPESELIVSSRTISRIGARRASSARLASSSSPGRSLAPFTIRPQHRQVAAPCGLQREGRVIDRSAAGPADDHERQAQHAREIRRGAVPADRRQQAGRPLDQHAVAAPAQREVHLAHVLGVDGRDRVAAARCQQVLARVSCARLRRRRRARARSASA